MLILLGDVQFDLNALFQTLKAMFTGHIGMLEGVRPRILFPNGGVTNHSPIEIKMYLHSRFNLLGLCTGSATTALDLEILFFLGFLTAGVSSGSL